MTSPLIAGPSVARAEWQPEVDRDVDAVVAGALAVAFGPDGRLLTQGSAEAALVVEKVCTSSGLTAEQIRGRGRTRKIAAGRHAVWLALHRLGWSWMDIAREFHVDHTTCMAAVRKLERGT